MLKSGTLVPRLFRLALVGIAVVLPTGSSGAQAPAADSATVEERAARLVNGGRAIAAVEDYAPQPPIRPLSPSEQRKRFVLQPGYAMEPVLAEPAIREPMQIAFDGNGRMFVLEMRSYMQDADATDEMAPTSRISLHEDTDGDGTYDHHTVYVDSMVVTRFVMPFGPNSILTAESSTDPLWKYTDTDGDGVADEKALFTTKWGRSANIEHQPSGLTWAMDNWMYATYNPFRIRWTPGGVIREESGSSASWSVTQDDDGKIWIQQGASGLPGYFQLPIAYGNFHYEDQFEEGLKTPYGLAGLGDYQPGPEASRPDGTLKEVTGSAGNTVFRGHRLPEELAGDYFYGEPVARVVRRFWVRDEEGLTRVGNVYQDRQSEFIRSTDPLFRPVDLRTVPDGTIYVVDVYRGIIQEGNWTPPGSHLRKKIEQYGLDKVTGHGRIWRLTHEDVERDRTRPRMNDEAPAELVRHLEHPNGWWRDTAQRLLVLHQDASVAPALRKMARESDRLTARFHALWTLEGLGALEAPLVRALLEDPHPRMRRQALRASETLYKAGDRSFAADYLRLAEDPHTDVVIQAMMTLDALEVPEAEAAIRAAMAANPARGVQLVGTQILEAEEGEGGPPEQLTEAQQALLERGAATYAQLCSECHGARGEGTPFGDGIMAPALARSPRVQGHPEYVVKTLLHGLAGPIEGEAYPGHVMVAMGENSDEWVAAVTSYVRSGFGNAASTVTPEYVEKVRAATADQAAPYTYEELAASLPRPLEPQPTWKATASHREPVRVGGSARPEGAFTLEGWTTGAAQEPGMWFQIELPEPATVSGLTFNAPSKGRRGDPPQFVYPRGYRVEVSADGHGWSTVAEGSGADVTSVERADGLQSTTTLLFEPVAAKHLRITQTAHAGVPWSMRSLRLYGGGR